MKTLRQSTSALDALWEQHRSLVEGPFRRINQETRKLDERMLQHVQDSLETLADTIATGEHISTQSVARAIRETLAMMGTTARNQCPSIDRSLHELLAAVLSPKVELSLDQVVCAVSALRTSLRE